MQKFYFSAQHQPVEPLWVQCIYRSAQKNLWIRHWNSYFCLQFSVQTCTIITRKFRFRECYFIKPVKGLWQFISSFTGCKSQGTLVSKRQIHHIIKLVQNNVPYKVELRLLPSVLELLPFIQKSFLVSNFVNAYFRALKRGHKPP